MFNLFKKKKSTGSQGSGAVESILNTVGIRLQSGWADWMGTQSAKLSNSNQKMLLMLFVAVSGSYCFYLLLNSFIGGNLIKLEVNPISSPAHIRSRNEENVQKMPAMRNKEFEGIIQFRLYMDSLALSPRGRQKYDSIVTNRPGLMDSIGIFEKYYQSRYKN